MRCQDVLELIHPYLDGEVSCQDAMAIEDHLTGCAECRENAIGPSSIKAAIKAHVTQPKAPQALKTRIARALDEVDAANGVAWRRMAPWLAGAAALAALVSFVLAEWVIPKEHVADNVGIRKEESSRDGTIVEDAIFAHEKNLPMEVRGGEELVRSFFAGRVPVPVRPPKLDAALVGARIGHLRGRDAAQIVYDVKGSPITVYVFNPDGLRISLGGLPTIQDHEVVTGGVRGYSFAYYREHGVGYAFASDLAENELLELVSTSLGK